MFDADAYILGLPVERRQELFLKRLAELTKRYGIKVTACSCCDGVHIRTIDGTNLGEDLMYKNGEWTTAEMRSDNDETT